MKLLICIIIPVIALYIYRIIFILFKLLSLMYTYLFMYMTKFMIILSIYVLYSLYSNFTFAACTPLIFDNLGHFSPQTLYFAILEPLFYEYLRVHIEYSSFIPRNLFLILCITLLVTCIYCTMYYMCIYWFLHSACFVYKNIPGRAQNISHWLLALSVHLIIFVYIMLLLCFMRWMKYTYT